MQIELNEQEAMFLSLAMDEAIAQAEHEPATDETIAFKQMFRGIKSKLQPVQMTFPEQAPDLEIK